MRFGKELLRFPHRPPLKKRPSVAALASRFWMVEWVGNFLVLGHTKEDTSYLVKCLYNGKTWLSFKLMNQYSYQYTDARSAGVVALGLSPWFCFIQVKT